MGLVRRFATPGSSQKLKAAPASPEPAPCPCARVPSRRVWCVRSRAAPRPYGPSTAWREPGARKPSYPDCDDNPPLGWHGRLGGAGKGNQSQSRPAKHPLLWGERRGTRRTPPPARLREASGGTAVRVDGPGRKVDVHVLLHATVGDREERSVRPTTYTTVGGVQPDCVTMAAAAVMRRQTIHLCAQHQHAAGAPHLH